MSTDTQKLRVLRARTNHDLLTVVSRELARGIALVDVATSRNSPLFAQAEKAFATAMVLLPRISDVSPHDRSRLEAKAAELRSRLEQMPAYANMRAYPASFAS